MSKETPMMRQYHRIKREHQGAILFFHMGDFYEMFYGDAEEASRILGIALTTRDRHKDTGVPLCGIPCHAAEGYIARLLTAGKSVAVCDQVEESSSARGLVKREVTRVITPGTVLDDRILEGKSNNFLVAVSPENDALGVSALDLSTGEFFFLEIPPDDLAQLEDRLSSLDPAEVLLAEGCLETITRSVQRASPRIVTPTWRCRSEFDPDGSRSILLEHFGVSTLESLGCEGSTAGVTAAGALLNYARETQHRPLANVVRLTPFHSGDLMRIDTAARRNLELTENLEDGRREGSLLSVLDRTVTSMGARKLKGWLLAPLMNPSSIDERLDAVASLVGSGAVRDRLRSSLSEIYDLERLSSRLSLNSGSPRDLAALRNSLRVLPRLVAVLRECDSPLLTTLADLDQLVDVCERIEERLVEEPPLRTRDGGLIRDGYSSELDELRSISRDARSWLASYEAGERERTGIGTLKVGYNKVFGYYIEVTKSNIGNVPEEYSRRQTLVNAERFQTAELRQFEGRILGAEERVSSLEQSLFEELRASLPAETARLQSTAVSVAVADVLQSLAEAALEHGYSRPSVNEELVLRIDEGRHPVVETAGEERFVPNDCRLDSGNCQIMIVTGPNMAGKSTYLRQVALITLMAQTGSFVPAKEAVVGVIDRIFTRIGAADKLSRGQSTFMVEMIETAAILRSATVRSLVILDEVGRGTSTFDGLSIAWAIVEHLHGNDHSGPKTLFATHYHQLTELPLTLPRACNFSIAVREWEGKILFLRKIVEGGTDKSYGIQVAQLAGLPSSAVERSKEILANLEESEFNLDGLPQIARRSVPPSDTEGQMDFFTPPGDEIVSRLRSLDVERTTPLDALSLLVSLKEEIEKKGF